MGEKYPRANLFNTEERQLTSSKIGRTYHLSVLLPLSYATPDKNYPVVYLLDGDTLFGMAASSTAFLQWGSAQEVIVVGICYDIESIDQWGVLRELDFKIPEVKDAPPTSHAPLFLDALTSEIIPFIETNYRTVPSQRGLYGFSSSGFFVLYTLFTQPEAFTNYLCGSGDLDIAYPYFVAHDEKLAKRNSNPHIKLYLTVGGMEENLIPFYHKFTSFFRDRKFPGLEVTSEIHAGEIHGPEAASLTYMHGIRSCYRTANQNT